MDESVHPMIYLDVIKYAYLISILVKEAQVIWLLQCSPIITWSVFPTLRDMVQFWGFKVPLQILIARFMGPTWGPSGANRTQMGPMLASWTLLSRMAIWCVISCHNLYKHNKIWLRYTTRYYYFKFWKGVHLYWNFLPFHKSYLHQHKWYWLSFQDFSVNDQYTVRDRFCNMV